MKNSKSIVSVFVLFLFSITGVSAEAQRQAASVTDRQVGVILQRLERSSSRFRKSLNAALAQGRLDQTRPQNDINSFEPGFESAINQFRDQFNCSRAGFADVQNVLQKASLINGVMTRNRLNRTVQNDWATLRGDLNTLAGAYNLSANWQNCAPQAPDSLNHRLTGTFRLNSARSDNPREAAERAIRNLPDSERQDVYDQIMTRLESPQMLTIERRGTTVTIASSLAARATFEADGRERQEQLGNGRLTLVTATLRGEQLVVSSNGYRENDFNVTFDATENDRILRVRRQIYSDRLTQPVVVDSVYDRIWEIAQWGVNNSRLLWPTTTR